MKWAVIRRGNSGPVRTLAKLWAAPRNTDTGGNPFRKARLVIRAFRPGAQDAAKAMVLGIPV